MEKLFKTKFGQSFSTDIIVVVVLILFGGLFLIVLKLNDAGTDPAIDQKYEVAALESKVLIENFKKEGIIDNQNEVDVEKLMQIMPEEVKEDLNIGNDFAIVFEKDGNLVKIDPENNINCVGSEKIIVNGVQCR
ncbi:MAG: hypothetical protein ACOCXG_05085 [Nanoarchaeota archaeon]